MGLELTLHVMGRKGIDMPESSPIASLPIHPYTELYDLIAEPDGKFMSIEFPPPKLVEKAVKTHPLPDNFSLWGTDETGVYVRRTNRLGGDLSYTTAGELAKVEIDPDEHHMNRAAFAYLRNLAEDIPVVIDWR